MRKNRFLVLLCFLLSICFFPAYAKEPVPQTPEVKSIKVSKAGNVILRWKKVSHAKGYGVYRSMTKKGGFVRLGTVAQSGNLYYKDKTAEEGAIYYYKIRAFREKNENRVWSKSSKPISVKIPGTLIIRAETYEEYGKAIALLCQQMDSGDTPGKKRETVPSKAVSRLIVKGKKGNLTFKNTKPEIVVCGPDNQYILQFKDSKNAKKAYKKIKKRKDIVYVEFDDIVTAG